MIQDILTYTVFEEDTTPILNPERGWYKYTMSNSSVSIYKTLRASGITMAQLNVDLNGFQNAPISAAKLNEIRNAFSTARQNDIAIIFRAAYSYDGTRQPEPRSMSVILNHIAQLGAIFREYEDTLYAIQAGFLGPWGEWHGSYYGDPPRLAERVQVLEAILENSPKSVFVQVRRPMFIRDIYNKRLLTESEAFTGSALSRVGWHNDALLSTINESGTYVEKSYSRGDELAWSDNHNRFTPFGGETNQLSAYSDPDNAIRELGFLHAQYINGSYHADVISKWKNTTYGGMSTHDYITNRLGYRFVMERAGLSQEAKRGAFFRVALDIRNDGFGNLLKEKEMELILRRNGVVRRAQIYDDVRLWRKGVTSREYYFSVPEDLPEGRWVVYLRVHSPFDSLGDKPERCIRFANKGAWEAALGANRIGELAVEGMIDDRFAYFGHITEQAARALMERVNHVEPDEPDNINPTAPPELSDNSATLRMIAGYAEIAGGALLAMCDQIKEILRRNDG